MNCDVVVIGGGLSGMSAAYYLKKRQPDLKVLVLEAKPRLGGRTLTVDMNIAGGKKGLFDLGGQWVGPLQCDLLAIMKELNMSELLYSQYTAGTKISWLAGNKIVKYKLDLPFYNPLIYLEAFFLIKKVNDLSRKLDADNPFVETPALANYLDSTTMETFLHQNVYSPELRECFRIAARACFGMEANQMSVLYVLLYGKSSGTLENVISATNEGTQKYRVKGGTQQISKRLGEIIGSENIRMNSPVTSVVQKEDISEVTALIEGNETKIYAKRIISAIPPNQLMAVKLEPSLPATRAELLRAMPMGNIYKFVITYEKAFWRENNYSGETVCHGGNLELNDDCPVGFACVSFDACLTDGTPALVGLIGGHQIVYWRNRAPAERRKAILASLAKMLGDEALKPVDFREKDWALEQWLGGCPVNVLQPGAGRFYTQGLRLPIGQIYMAGTESAQRSCGFLSGAVQAGRRAATEVLYSLDMHSSEDDDILPLTCFGSSGKSSRRPQKWLLTTDKSVDTVSYNFPVVKALVLLGALYFSKRYQNSIRAFVENLINKFPR